MNVKEEMEKQWEEGGCASSVYFCRWKAATPNSLKWTKSKVSALYWQRGKLGLLKLKTNRWLKRPSNRLLRQKRQAIFDFEFSN